MRDTKIVAVLSQKGGAGKTTVAMQLAAGLVLQGYQAAVVDLDPQESAARWGESAVDPLPFAVLRVRGDRSEIERQLHPIALRADVIVLDCPPSIDHPHTHAALELCDLALIPVVPSPTDLWSTRGMEALVLRHMRERPRLRGVLLPNRVMRTALAGDVLKVLGDFTLPVLNASLSQRSAFAESAVRGASVYGLGRAAAAAQAEVDKLALAVLDELDE